ncbi:hypothetical protein BH10ACI1_BH10ACI1_11510 [soil metagenome]
MRKGVEKISAMQNKFPASEPFKEKRGVISGDLSV